MAPLKIVCFESIESNDVIMPTQSRAEQGERERQKKRADDIPAIDSRNH